MKIRRRIWGLGSEPRPLQLMRAVAKDAILAIFPSFVKVFLSIPDVICRYVTKIVTPSRSGKPMAADLCSESPKLCTTFLPNNVRSRINRLIAGYLVRPTNKDVNGYLITVWQDCIEERLGSIPARPI